MSSTQLIRTIFASDINRTIEEVIKVDQHDEEVLCDEIAEYVVTDSIRSRYVTIFDKYAATPNQPHEGIGIWVSGFYGSGKSSFAKMLGLSIQSRVLAGVPASQRFANRAGDPKLTVLLNAITEKIPTHAVIFDVSTDRGIRSGNQTLTEITYGLLLQSLGYAKDLDLSELEITLEGERPERLSVFEDGYRRIFGKEWSAEKGKVAFAINEASRVMHSLDPETYPMADSWSVGAKGRNDITARLLGKRADELMKRRRPGQHLMFVVDEVGQFVARDVQKMLDLQAMVQQLGVVGRGRLWLVVTSQERLGELVSGLDDKRVEHARLMDRFPSELQVHLESSDISEVTSRRVLAKDAAAQAALGTLFDEHRARLTDHTRLTADIRLPELSRDAFIDLYPLLPYQIDLVIGVVSGLRTQGGSSPHVGGANRTIIKLAQQLLINPAVALAEQPIGALVRLDQVYDLVEGNIASEVRAKIGAIASELHDPHPLAQSVAKVICLLQYVKSVHRTAENIAACLHPEAAADSQLASVQEALRLLEESHLVRSGDDGYRIPTPAEDDWERTRNGASPKPGDAHRIYQELIESLWQPQPSHLLLGIKPFKAGLALRGRSAVEGDITFQFHIADDDAQLGALGTELRDRSRAERSDIFWAVGLTNEIDAAVVELYRSRTVIDIKEREARTASETVLVSEEKRRRDGQWNELRKRFTMACLSGSVFFRGNDRSPGADASDVAKSAAAILADVTPEIFERFHEGAARTADAKKATDALLVAENLRGLPAVFGTLGLLRDEKGKTVLEVERGPLREALARIQERSDYGQTANGRLLVDEFAKEPFGWDFEVVRLLTLCLLRAGSIEATSKGQAFDSATGPEAIDTFSNNAVFRQASFRPKKRIDFPELVKAGEAFTDTFGSEVRELAQASIVAQLRAEIDKATDRVSEALAALNSDHLPGAGALQAGLEPMRAILRGSEEAALTTFNASHRSIKDAIKRAAELDDALTAPHLADIERARWALEAAWPFLATEPDLSDGLRSAAAELEDLLGRETFFREFPAIDQHAASIGAEYEERHAAAVAARVAAYETALDELRGTPGWTDLSPDDQALIAAPLELGRTKDGAPIVPIPQVRSDGEVCPIRLQRAVDAVLRSIDGDRVATISLRPYFAGGIETDEQLEAALTGIREECSRLIGAGKKIVIG
jgi:hypothetical protein